MRAYLLKRLLLLPVTLIGITFITFIVMKLAPGDPAKILRAQAAGQSMKATQANAEALENWKRERHLDKSIPMQYAYWLGDLLTFDLGRSLMTGRERVSKIMFGTVERVHWGRLLCALALLGGLIALLVFRPGPLRRAGPDWSLPALAVAAAGVALLALSLDVAWGRVWVTLAYNLVAFFLIYSVAIPVGILAATKQFTLWDRVMTIGVFLLYSLPSFWIGTLLIAYCTGRLFATTGYYPRELGEVGFLVWFKELLRHAVLPVVCLTYGGFAFLSRQMRSALLEQIRQDFVRTARAKGLSERVVVLRHATRNALIPIITLLGNLLPAMIGGSIIVEQLFSIPGMGQLFFNAVNERDYTVIMGIEVVTALLTMFGILVSDVLYVLVNPTIAYE